MGCHFNQNLIPKGVPFGTKVTKIKKELEKYFSFGKWVRTIQVKAIKTLRLPCSKRYTF